MLIITVNHLNINKKVTGQTGANGEKNVKIMESLKYLTNFWGILEMSFINCEINPILNWSEKRVIASNTAAAQATTFIITDTKLYVPVVTLSLDDNAKLLQQLKSDFKETIN